MSDPANTFRDGAYLWDSIEVVLGTKTFIFENWPIEEKATVDITNNVNMVPRGSRARRQLMQFDSTLQYPSGATLADTPALFATFTAPFRGVPHNFYFSAVGHPQQAGQEIKCKVTVTELLNGLPAGS